MAKFYPKEEREVEKWVTVKGKHVPIYKDSKKKQSMSIKDFDLEDTWTDEEKENLQKALDFISDNFGDVTDIVDGIYKSDKLDSSFHGLYDLNETYKKGKSIYINSKAFGDEDVFIHEFIHAVDEKITAQHKKFGYSFPWEFQSALRSEVYSNLGMAEPEYSSDNFWKDRPAEFFPIAIQAFSSTPKRGYVRRKDFKVSDKSNEALKVLKKYWKKIK